MAKPSKPISKSPLSERSRSSGCMPPWMMPNRAEGESPWASRERLAQRSDSSMDFSASSKVAG